MTKKSRDSYDYDYDYEDERRPAKKSSGSTRKSSGARYDDERPSGKKKSSSKKKKKEQAKKKRRRIILFIAELFVLSIMVVVLYGVMKGEKTGKMELDEEKIIVNDVVKEKEETTMKGYRNIALFGVDSTTGSLTKDTRSDTIMIASINQDTGECKLVSVFRDTYLNLSNDTYNKCNAAYAQGGPEQAISMLNANLDLDITDYVTIGFAGLIDAVDALGGVEMEVTESEISHLNNYQLCMAEELGVDYIPVQNSGRQLLNGMQATAYCRIRYTKGDDFRRAERQRDVLRAMMDKAQGASVGELTEMVNAVLPQVETSLNVNEVLSVLGSVAGYQVVASDGFPFEGNRVGANVGSRGSCVIPDNLEENVKQLHEALYPEKAYVPSRRVQDISNEIEEMTREYIQ